MRRNWRSPNDHESKLKPSQYYSAVTPNSDLKSTKISIFRFIFLWCINIIRFGEALLDLDRALAARALEASDLKPSRLPQYEVTNLV